MPMKSMRTPFPNMTFSPDVPSTALGPNEYNAGYNVETDVRGIRSVAGDETFFAAVPGTPNYVSGGYREDGNFSLTGLTLKCMLFGFTYYSIHKSIEIFGNM